MLEAMRDRGTRRNIAMEHQQMIRLIQELPEFSILSLWTPEQSQYLENQKRFWVKIGVRIDYLQQLLLGYRPQDPVELESHPVLKVKVKVYSDYLFALLQVIISVFDEIKRVSKKKGIDFPFQDPRQLFAQICKEFADSSIKPIVHYGAGNGPTLSEIRNYQQRASKFYRGKLSTQESEEMVEAFFKSGFWAGFAIAAIYSNEGAQHLQNPRTERGQKWKSFKDAHKQLYRFVKSQKVGALRWNRGRPVWSSMNDMPAYF